jgi:hypothetical protein
MNQRNTQSTNQGVSTLDAYRDQKRLLLIFADDETDPAYQQQQQMLDGQETACEDRDLLIFHLFANGESTIAGTQSPTPVPADLRDQFGIEEDEFAVVLIGKDGTVKLHTDQPTAIQQIFGLIDDMPMRQGEMARDAKKRNE